MKHIIATTHKLETTWFYEVEADTPEEALEKFAGNHDRPTHLVQSVGDASAPVIVSAIPEGAIKAPAPLPE